MKSFKQNKAFPDKIMSEVQQKLFDCEFVCEKKNKKSRIMTDEREYVQTRLNVGDYKNPRLKMPSKLEDKYFLNQNNIIETIKPVCKNCYSHKVIKWNIQKREIISENFNGNISIQRYKCKKCGKTFQTDFNGIINPYAIFTNDEKAKAIAVKELNSSSLRDIAKYFDIFYGYQISHETVRNTIMVIKGNEITYNPIKLSGYYGYDAQWVRINKKWKYRHVIFDIDQKIPVAEYFTDKDNKEIVYEFIERNIPSKDRTAIVTDMKPGYDEVMTKLKFERHQYCIFHLKQAINKKITKHIKELKKEKEKIKQEYEGPSDEFIEKEIKRLAKAENNDIDKALEILYSLFDCETFEDANEEITKIKEKSIDFPEFLKEYLDKNFFPIYKSFIYYLEKPYKNHLERTNNRTEGYFRITMPKKNKRNYRSFKGLINEIYHKGIGWIKKKEKKANKKLIKED